MVIFWCRSQILHLPAKDRKVPMSRPWGPSHRRNWQFVGEVICGDDVATIGHNVRSRRKQTWQWNIRLDTIIDSFFCFQELNVIYIYVYNLEIWVWCFFFEPHLTAHQMELIPGLTRVIVCFKGRVMFTYIFDFDVFIYVYIYIYM